MGINSPKNSLVSIAAIFHFGWRRGKAILFALGVMAMMTPNLGGAPGFRFNDYMALALVGSAFAEDFPRSGNGTGAATRKNREQQMDQSAVARIIRKMDTAFVRDVSGFADLTGADREEYFKLCVSAAQKIGLKTEQGIASYALAVWWLGINFEAASVKLVALLSSDYPEVRKVHAMNEWVNAAIGAPDDIAAADEKLRQALQVTEAWGR